MTKQLTNPAEFLSQPKAKKARTAPKATPKATPKAKSLPRIASIEDCGPEGLEDLLPKQEQSAPVATSNLAAQLAAAAPASAVAQSEKAVKRAVPDLKLVWAKEFKPRTNHIADGDKGNFAQRANWDALVQAIQAHGGAITYAEAVAAVEAAGKAGGYEKTCNARGFVQGRIRNGHVTAA